MFMTNNLLLTISIILLVNTGVSVASVPCVPNKLGVGCWVNTDPKSTNFPVQCSKTECCTAGDIYYINSGNDNLQICMPELPSHTITPHTTQGGSCTEVTDCKDFDIAFTGKILCTDSTCEYTTYS